jgi:HEAT repeat protein
VPKDLVPTLIVMMRSPSVEVRAQAVHRLQMLGPAAGEAVAVLRENLGGHCSYVREGAARALYTIGEEREAALQTMTEVVRDGRGDTRASAAYWLGSLGAAGRPAERALLEAARTETFGQHRATLFMALGKIGPTLEEGVPVCIEALGSKDTAVRTEAAMTLGRFGSKAEAAIPALLPLADEANSSLRAAVESALARIGLPQGPGLKVITDALADPRKTVRAAAASCLGGATGDDARAAAGALASALKDTDPDVRKAAAAALGRIGPPAKTAAPALEEARDREFLKDVAAVMTEALTRIGAPSN